MKVIMLKTIEKVGKQGEVATMSMMIRLSNLLATIKAMRDGILAFMRPVMTSMDGRCVASTR